MESFDFTKALPKRTTSANTQRAYYRWTDQYLVDIAGLKGTRGADRIKRMEDLPIKSLQRHLTQRKLKNWLNRLVESGQGRQALDQARATIVTLSELLADADLIGDDIAAEIQSVSVPSIKKKQTLRDKNTKTISLFVVFGIFGGIYFYFASRSEFICFKIYA